jgi:hypothetical protein
MDAFLVFQFVEPEKYLPDVLADDCRGFPMDEDVGVEKYSHSKRARRGPLLF